MSWNKDDEGEWEEETRPCLRNPSSGWRVALVAAVWAVPGALVGEMLNLFTPLSSDPLTGFIVGASVAAFLGGLLEHGGTATAS